MSGRLCQGRFRALDRPADENEHDALIEHYSVFLNNGVGFFLLALVAIMFRLTVVKALILDDVRQMGSFDHVSQLVEGSRLVSLGCRRELTD